MDNHRDRLLLLLKSSRLRYALLAFFSAVAVYFVGKKVLRYCGARPSRKDRRDYVMAGADAPPPSSFSLAIPEIKDQGQVGSCVAHSMSYISEYLMVGKPARFDKASVGWVYGYRPDGYYRGEGMYPRDALKTLRDCGSVRHVFFPYNKEVPLIMDMVQSGLHDLKKHASENRISVFFSVKEADDVKKCLMKYGPVSVMYPVHEEFMRPVNGVVDVKGLKKFQGYHQVTIYGWKPGYWLVVNSWGEGWGNGGVAWVSDKYPSREMWGVSTDPSAGIPQKKTFLSGLLNGLGR